MQFISHHNQDLRYKAREADLIRLHEASLIERIVRSLRRR